MVWSLRVEALIAFVNNLNRHLKDCSRVVSSLKPFCCKWSTLWVVVLRSSVIASHVTRRVLSHLLNTPNPTRKRLIHGGLQLSSRIFRKGQARKTIEYEAYRLPQVASPYSLPRNTGYPHRSWLLLQPILGRSRQRRMLFLW